MSKDMATQALATIIGQASTFNLAQSQDAEAIALRDTLKQIHETATQAYKECVAQSNSARESTRRSVLETLLQHGGRVQWENVKALLDKKVVEQNKKIEDTNECVQWAITEIFCSDIEMGGALTTTYADCWVGHRLQNPL